MDPVTIKSDQQLHWPAKCAMCNAPAEKQVTASCSVLRGGIPIPFALILVSRVLRVTYPVCKKHRLRAWFAAGLSERNLFYLGLGFLSFFLPWFTLRKLYLQLTTDVPQDFGGLDVFSIIFFVCYWGLYFWAKRNTPIRIKGGNKEEISFEFSNKEFSAEFRALNNVAS